MPPHKTLERKLALLHKNPRHRAFILADAKDADMALGVASPGPARGPASENFPYRTMADYRQQIRQIVQQGLVDIMLMSCSTSEQLTICEKLFDGSRVTPAVRANDTTDIHVCREACYPKHASRPFASATIDQIQSGKAVCTEKERRRGAGLGLYSVTFNNIPKRDYEMMQAYKAFRLEAETKGFRHFLEVFDPNVAPDVHKIPAPRIGAFVNDHICRLLAGVPTAGRPIFLKIAYHGPRYMEELCRYDESVIVGILGGSSGTTYDAFNLLAEAKKYGARVALFGRRINHAEDQLSFVKLLRAVADDQLAPEAAVREYHGMLQTRGITPHRTLDDDFRLTSGVHHYAANGVVVHGTKRGQTVRGRRSAVAKRAAS
jgi:hypothetical protein